MEMATNCKEFIGSKIEKSIDNYKRRHYNKIEKLVYMRKLFLPRTCKKLLDRDKSVSIRNRTTT